MAKMYVAKVNLITNISDLYEGENLQLMKQHILTSINDRMEYTQIIKKNADGKEIKETYKYNLLVIERTATEIYGKLVRKGKIFYKTLDNIPGNIKSDTDIYNYHSPEAAEEITFLYDVFAEKIAFNIKRRFKYKQFIEGMTGIINKAMDSENSGYKFELSLCTTSINVEKLIESLNSIVDITELEFKFQLPNPEDEELEAIKNNPEEYIDALNDGNIDDFSTVFRSKKGINIESRPVKENMEMVNRIHSSIPGAIALRNGYAKVFAKSKSGVNYSSEEDGIFSRDINEKVNYLNFCRETITILRRR